MTSNSALCSRSITTLSTLASTSANSSAASSTPSDTPGTGTNVGGIIGGIAGALLGLTVLAFVVRFIIKRYQRRNDEDGAAAFNAGDFRRSAVLMNDPPTHNETVERGYNPRPPTMIERRLASPAPTFGTQYGAPGPYEAARGNEYGNMDQYGQYQSYGPGQMNNMSPPVSATSAHPMYLDQAYGQSPFSPMGSPVSAMGPGYDGSQAAILTRQPSSATQLSRNNSAGANGYRQDDSTQFANYPNYPNQHLSAQNEYVDLNRSSVTPYQAAQYAEISMRLNTDIPEGLDTPAVNQFVRSSNEGAPPVPANDHSSPFADPVLPASLLAGSGRGAERPSPDSVSRDLDEFPAPPSPAHSSRVDSAPPMLPEIYVESRTPSYDFPASAHGSSVASGYPSGVAKDFSKSPLGSQFPATPSPMASSFGVATPPPAATSFPGAAPAAEVKSEKKRPDTVYDDEDAYGGF
ncbi:hypothetical protein FPV67DRAFT_620659 [Lyophyllum atratum]|nr:hypothetical protein FPV67DRAFT_620659 [Lyophyllum atratum]